MTALIKAHWQRLLTISLLLFLMGSCYRLGQIDERRTWQDKWNARNTSDAVARAKQEVANRAEEQRRRDEMEQVTQHAEQQLATLRADAAAARGAAERLRRTVSQLQRNNSSTDTRADNTGASGRAGSSMLADVLAESVERNQQLAAEADRRRIAGMACERAYDSLIQHH